MLGVPTVTYTILNPTDGCWELKGTRVPNIGSLSNSNGNAATSSPTHHPLPRFPSSGVSSRVAGRAQQFTPSDDSLQNQNDELFYRSEYDDDAAVIAAANSNRRRRGDGSSPSPPPLPRRRRPYPPSVEPLPPPTRALADAAVRAGMTTAVVSPSSTAAHSTAAHLPVDNSHHHPTYPGPRSGHSMHNSHHPLVEGTVFFGGMGYDDAYNDVWIARVRRRVKALDEDAGHEEEGDRTMMGSDDDDASSSSSSSSSIRVLRIDAGGCDNGGGGGGASASAAATTATPHHVNDTGNGGAAKSKIKDVNQAKKKSHPSPLHSSPPSNGRERSLLWELTWEEIGSQCHMAGACVGDDGNADTHADANDVVDDDEDRIVIGPPMQGTTCGYPLPEERRGRGRGGDDEHEEDEEEEEVEEGDVDTEHQRPLRSSPRSPSRHNRRRQSYYALRPPCFGHAACLFDGNTKLFVHGGTTTEGELLDAPCYLDLIEKKWYPLTIQRGDFTLTFVSGGDDNAAAAAAAPHDGEEDHAQATQRAVKSAAMKDRTVRIIGKPHNTITITTTSTSHNSTKKASSSPHAFRQYYRSTLPFDATMDWEQGGKVTADRAIPSTSLVFRHVPPATSALTRPGRTTNNLGYINMSQFIPNVLTARGVGEDAATGEPSSFLSSDEERDADGQSSPSPPPQSSLLEIDGGPRRVLNRSIGHRWGHSASTVRIPRAVAVNNGWEEEEEGEGNEEEERTKSVDSSSDLLEFIVIFGGDVKAYLRQERPHLHPEYDSPLAAHQVGLEEREATYSGSTAHTFVLNPRTWRSWFVPQRMCGFILTPFHCWPHLYDEDPFVKMMVRGEGKGTKAKKGGNNNDSSSFSSASDADAGDNPTEKLQQQQNNTTNTHKEKKKKPLEPIGLASPFPRRRHASAVARDRFVIIFGGRTEPSETFRGDTWVFDSWHCLWYPLEHHVSPRWLLQMVGGVGVGAGGVTNTNKSPLSAFPSSSPLSQTPPPLLRDFASDIKLRKRLTFNIKNPQQAEGQTLYCLGGPEMPASGYGRAVLERQRDILAHHIKLNRYVPSGFGTAFTSVNDALANLANGAYSSHNASAVDSSPCPRTGAAGAMCGDWFLVQGGYHTAALGAGAASSRMTLRGAPLSITRSFNEMKGFCFGGGGGGSLPSPPSAPNKVSSSPSSSHSHPPSFSSSLCMSSYHSLQGQGSLHFSEYDAVYNYPPEMTMSAMVAIPKPRAVMMVPTVVRKRRVRARNPRRGGGDDGSSSDDEADEDGDDEEEVLCWKRQAVEDFDFNPLTSSSSSHKAVASASSSKAKRALQQYYSGGGGGSGDDGGDPFHFMLLYGGRMGDTPSAMCYLVEIAHRVRVSGGDEGDDEKEDDASTNAAANSSSGGSASSVRQRTVDRDRKAARWLESSVPIAGPPSSAPPLGALLSSPPSSSSLSPFPNPTNTMRSDDSTTTTTTANTRTPSSCNGYLARMCVHWFASHIPLRDVRWRRAVMDWLSHRVKAERAQRGGHHDHHHDHHNQHHHHDANDQHHHQSRHPVDFLIERCRLDSGGHEQSKGGGESSAKKDKALEEQEGNRGRRGVLDVDVPEGFLPLQQRRRRSRETTSSSSPARGGDVVAEEGEGGEDNDNAATASHRRPQHNVHHHDHSSSTTATATQRLSSFPPFPSRRTHHREDEPHALHLSPTPSAAPFANLNALLANDGDGEDNNGSDTDGEYYFEEDEEDFGGDGDDDDFEFDSDDFFADRDHDGWE